MSDSPHRQSHGPSGVSEAAPERVQAYFDEEVAAQEAMGLLAFHGFRTDGIVLRAAGGTRWRRVRPAKRASRGSSRRSWRLLVLGAGGGLVVSLVGLALAGSLVVALVPILAVVGGGLGGVLLVLATGRSTAPSPRPASPSSDVMTPIRGCVVTVRTLRTDEARVVLERADGVLVVAAEATDLAIPDQG